MRKTSFEGHIFDISERKSITDALFTDGVYNENNFANILSIASKTLHRRFTHGTNCRQYAFISSVMLIKNHNISTEHYLVLCVYAWYSYICMC